MQTEECFFISTQCFLILYNKKSGQYHHLILSAVINGGDGRDRTVDLLNAIQALSQLSYAPRAYLYYHIFSMIASVIFKNVWFLIGIFIRYEFRGYGFGHSIQQERILFYKNVISFFFYSLDILILCVL